MCEENIVTFFFFHFYDHASGYLMLGLYSGYGIECIIVVFILYNMCRFCDNLLIVIAYVEQLNKLGP